MDTVKTQTRATYGCRSESVSGLGMQPRINAGHVSDTQHYLDGIAAKISLC